MSHQNLKIQADFQRNNFHFQVDLNLPMQGVTVIFGRSGCGKTTLLRVIAGLEHIPNVNVTFADCCWQNTKHFTPLHQRRIGLVFQEHSLFPHLTVRGNLLYGFNRTPVDQRRLTLKPIADLLGLSELLDRRIDALSGGQRQRVAIGRALLTSPQLLLLDEPLSALDAITKREIMPFLEHLSQQVGIPIVMISHSAKEVERLADRVIFMADGKVERVETLQQALARADSPLFADEGASSVLMAEVVELQAGDGLSRLQPVSSQCSLWLPEVAHAGRYRVRLLAKDVGISLTAPTDSSLLNVFHVKVERIETMQASALVSLSLGEQSLFAQISLRSLKQLQLSVGLSVYALIKAMALV